MAKTLSRIKTVDITVIEDGKERVEKITAHKVALGKWKRLITSTRKLFKLVPEVLKDQGIEDPQAYIDQMDLQDLLLLIPDMLEVAADECINVLALGANLEAEYIEENVGLDEAVDLFEAIIEVNNLIKVVETGKNLMTLWRAGQRAANLLQRK